MRPWLSSLIFLTGLACADEAPSIDLSTTLGSAPDYRVGDRLELLIDVYQPGHLAVWHLSADNTLTKLFPNAWQPQSAWAPQMFARLPALDARFRWNLSPPLGEEKVLLFYHPTQTDWPEASVRRWLNKKELPAGGEVELLTYQLLAD